MRHNVIGSISTGSKSVVVGFAALLLACLAVFSGATFAAAAPAVPLAEGQPVAVNDEYTVAYNTMLVVPVGTGILANDTNLPANPTYKRINDANHNAANSFSNDGSFTYTPDTDFVGDDSYTYCISTSQFGGECLSNTATILIHVIGPPPAPVAVDDTFYPHTGETVSANGILLNDTNVPAGASYKLITLGAHALSSNFHPDGSFTYTATVGYVGDDSYTYCVTALFGTGACLSNTATILIHVLPLPPPPVATNDSYSTPVNTTLTVTAPGFLANDDNFNDFPGAFAVLTNFAHASDFDLNGDGSIKYVPVTGFVGVDTATYCLTEGSETSVCISNVVTITITVAAPVAATTTPVATATPTSGILAATGTNELPLSKVGILLAIAGGLMLALANAGRRRHHS